MNEIEIRPGLFITFISQEEYKHKLSILTGDEKVEYLEKVNPFNEISPDSCFTIFGMSRQILTLFLWSFNEEFNPKTDYIYLRYDPKPSLSEKPAS